MGRLISQLRHSAPVLYPLSVLPHREQPRGPMIELAIICRSSW